LNSQELKDRTKKLTIDCIEYIRSLSKNDESGIICKQLLRSVSSTAANYRAACLARSDAGFYSKISISVEEADETLFWLEIINDSKIDNSDELHELLKEASEILFILSSSRKTTKKRITKFEKT